MKMNKHLLPILKISVIIIAFFISSCNEEPFNPVGEFKQIYTLNCVIDGNTSLQTASVSQSYFVNGTDPESNTEDPFLAGAEIKIWKGDNVYILKDTSVARIDTSRYKTPFHFYYITGFQPKPGDNLEIEALLPNGIRLKSSTKMPIETTYDYEICDSIIPSIDKDYIYITWSEQAEDVFYLPRAVLYYNQTVNGRLERKSKIVPSSYINDNGVKKAIYHSPSFSTSAAYDNEAFTEVLQEISNGDSKKNYSILTVVFEALVFDRSLTAYYSTSNIDANNYSVLLDRPDFTNIQGGFGIFGAYSIKKMSMPFDADYLKSLGYN